jgi:hypothetical protein
MRSSGVTDRSSHRLHEGHTMGAPEDISPPGLFLLPNSDGTEAPSSLKGVEITATHRCLTPP